MRLLVIGLGYTGRAIAARAARAGWRVTGTAREPGRAPPLPGVEIVAFDDPAPFAAATHVVMTAAPGTEGDPALARHGAQLAPRWVGYISTTGVYGDRGGGWVDEATEPAPGQERSRRRLLAEQAWAALPGAAVNLFRTGGIYGPGRSPLDDVRAGSARRVEKPGHSFSRIHRDDIARAVLAALAQQRPPGPRVLHLVDDEPAPQADVVLEAARLLGVAPPPPIPFETARAGMSEMGLSFWSENRRVANDRTKAALGLDWAYPSYREGLRAVLVEERDRPGAAGA